MTIAVGQSVYTNLSYSGTPVTSAAITTAATGSSFVVFCIGPASVTFTVTDSKSNTYTLQGTQQNNVSDGIALAAYLATNGTGGTGHTFSMAMSTHATVLWFAVEVTGGVTSSILDQFFGNTGFLGDPTPGPVTTTNATDLILSVFQDNGTVLTGVTPGTGFTNLITNLSDGNAVVQRVVTSTGTYDPSITFTPSGGRTQIITLALKSGGSPTFSLPASSGTYTYTGKTISGNQGFSLVSAAGTYAYTGEPAGVFPGSNSIFLLAASGAYDLVGASALSDYELDNNAGIYGYTGQNAVLSQATNIFTLSAAAGTYGYVGQNVIFSSLGNVILTASSGTYAYFGQAATLSQASPGGAFILPAGFGFYTYAGIPATLTVFTPPVTVIVPCTTNFDLISYAYQKIGVIDENSSPTNEQGVVGLSVLNDYLLNEAADGMRLGWFTQYSLQNCCPLRPEDVFGVKILLAMALAAHYGITIQNPQLLEAAQTVKTQLVKRSIRYSEADFSELSRPQGGPWGGPNWI